VYIHSHTPNINPLIKVQSHTVMVHLRREHQAVHTTHILPDTIIHTCLRTCTQLMCITWPIIHRHSIKVQPVTTAVVAVAAWPVVCLCHRCQHITMFTSSTIRVSTHHTILRDMWESRILLRVLLVVETRVKCQKSYQIFRLRMNQVQMLEQMGLREK
jgi:hypothetical protein